MPSAQNISQTNTRGTSDRSYAFKPVRAQRLMVGVVIYAALVFVLFATVSSADLAYNLRLLAGLPPPIFVVVLLLFKRDVLKLSITDRELTMETGSGILRSTVRKFPLNAVRFARGSRSITVSSGDAVVGVIRKSSATEEEWRSLLADIEGK